MTACLGQPHLVNCITIVSHTVGYSILESLVYEPLCTRPETLGEGKDGLLGSFRSTVPYTNRCWVSVGYIKPNYFLAVPPNSRFS